MDNDYLEFITALRNRLMEEFKGYLQKYSKRQLRTRLTCHARFTVMIGKRMKSYWRNERGETEYGC
jgi:hypothetical protein